MSKKHGLRGHRLYRIYAHIKERCFKPKTKHYEHYGGRGITMSEEWVADFVSFYNWAVSNGYKDDLTIDRRDNDGNYTPENCRWITQQEQLLNRQNTVYITYEGMTKTLLEWAKEKNISYRTIYYRWKQYNYPVERLFEATYLREERKKKRIMISDKDNKDIMIVASNKIAAIVTKTDTPGVWRQMKGKFEHRGGFKFRHV